MHLDFSPYRCAGNFQLFGFFPQKLHCMLSLIKLGHSELYDLCILHVQRQPTNQPTSKGQAWHGRRRWAARRLCRSSSSPCPFPAPDTECGSGSELSYRGGSSHGRGPAWHLCHSSGQPSHSSFSSPSSSSSSSSTSSFTSFFSPCCSSTSYRGESVCGTSTTGCSTPWVPSAVEGLPKSPLLCGRSKSCWFSASWIRKWPAHSGTSWVVHSEVGC